MRELMLELLTYEPFGKFLAAEDNYIRQILAGNYQQPQSLINTLFSDFYNCVQQEDFQNIAWLQQWKAAYGRAHQPQLFKKICFYLMVKGKHSERDFMKQIGFQVSRIRDWGISPEFRKYAEADSYSTISSFRNGVKKEYIVSTIKRLYYEAGRQTSQSMILKNMPPFVDLFAGTATVAASMIERKSKASRERSSQIVNDADPLMICFAWAFTYHQKELRSRLAKFQNRIMKEDFNFNNSSYTESEYENHYGFMDSLMRLKSDEYWEDKSKKYWEKELLTNPKIWDNFVIQLRYSKSYIAKAKKKAQRYKEFIIRIRSWYEDDERYWKSLDRDALRKINFNELPKDKINNQVDDILDYALAVFYYYSFKPRGKNLFL